MTARLAASVPLDDGSTLLMLSDGTEWTYTPVTSPRIPAFDTVAEMRAIADSAAAAAATS